MLPRSSAFLQRDARSPVISFSLLGRYPTNGPVAGNWLGDHKRAQIDSFTDNTTHIVVVLAGERRDTGYALTNTRRAEYPLGLNIPVRRLQTQGN